MLSSITSCNKSVESNVEQVSISAEVASGEVYQLNMSNYGSKAAITKQVATYSQVKSLPLQEALLFINSLQQQR
jgi:hypothetical protein